MVAAAGRHSVCQYVTGAAMQHDSLDGNLFTDIDTTSTNRARFLPPTNVTYVGSFNVV